MLTEAKTTMLHSFYAVTLTSVYLVKDRRDKNDPRPVAKKVALKGESEIGVGEELEGGTMLAITQQLQMFIPEGGGLTSFQRHIEDVNTRYWCGHSSNIVALFLKKDEAMECLNQPELQKCDPRWIEQTKMVIEKIGADHPVFEVCRWGCLALLPA